MTVTLESIDRDNWRQVIRLEVAPEQQSFVASNLYSIAESKFYSYRMAAGLYRSMGFEETGRIEDGEVVVRLSWPP